MKVGFHVPQWGAGATREGVLGVARCVEDAGLDSVWVADHIIYPTAGARSYPYDEETSFGPDDGFLEGLTVLGALAAVTERVMLGTSVLVMPMRAPLITAKTIATVDVLSEGRTLVAMGAGWWREEFDALGQPFEGRGARFNEQIEALRLLWRDGRGSYAGNFVHFDEVICEPRPVQPGGPPIFIGGTGAAALRRAATLGDGWHALGVHEETLRAGMARIAELALAAGRDPSMLGLNSSTVLPGDRDTALRRLIRLAELGVRHVVLDARAEGPDEARRTIEWFAEDVLPAVRAETGGDRQHLQRT